MAQLIKLSNYISRYENDLTRYSSQFIRLKKQHWDRLKVRWASGDTPSPVDEEHISITEHEEVERSKLKSFLNKFKFKKEQGAQVDISQEDEEEDEDMAFNPEIVYLPNTIDELKRIYVDQLFHFQMKWASSTFSEVSKVSPKYLRDSMLRELVQQLPDQYFILYDPVMFVQKAPVELDVIIVTPLECLLVTVIEEENLAAFTEDTQRFWMKRIGEREEKVLNPMIALNRMSKMVTQLLANDDIDMPVRKCLVSRNGYIDYPYSSQDFEVVDRRNYTQWFQALQNVQAPFKYRQFRTVQSLLERMETNSIHRLFLQGDEEEL